MSIQKPDKIIQHYHFIGGQTEAHRGAFPNVAQITVGCRSDESRNVAAIVFSGTCRYLKYDLCSDSLPCSGSLFRRSGKREFVIKTDFSSRP